MRYGLGVAKRFARGDTTSAIAVELRVTERTVRRWRQAWPDGETAALRSKGPVSRGEAEPSAVCPAGDGAGQRAAGGPRNSTWSTSSSASFNLVNEVQLVLGCMISAGSEDLPISSLRNRSVSST